MKKGFIAVILLAVMLSGCHANVSTNPTKLTPFQRVIQANTALAEANHDVAKMLIQAADTKVLSASKVGTALGFQEKIADYDKQLTQILQKGPAAISGDSDAIKDLVAKIQATAKDLLSDYNVSQANDVTAALGAVLSTSASVLQILVQEGVIK
jgi:hypothetical protein